MAALVHVGSGTREDGRRDRSAPRPAGGGVDAAVRRHRCRDRQGRRHDDLHERRCRQQARRDRRHLVSQERAAHRPQHPVQAAAADARLREAWAASPSSSARTSSIMPSRRGIERLGAKLDGILRSHQRASDGTLRDTCVYSIIASEWPTVKSHLDLAAEQAAGVTSIPSPMLFDGERVGEGQPARVALPLTPTLSSTGEQEARCSAGCSRRRSAQSAPKGAAALGPSAHVDTFTRDNLPPAEQWPDLLLDRPEFHYPEYLNAAVELTDRMVEKGFGDHTALIGNGRRRTYKELTDWTQPAGARAGRGLRRQARQPRADPLRQQPGHGGGWLAATKAGARGRQHHADAARRRARQDRRQGRDRPRALRQPHRRRAGRLRQGQPLPRRRSSASTAPPTTTPSSTASRSSKSVQLRGRADRARRRGAAGLHLRHHRRAQGHHALPPRPADHRRRLRQGGAGRDAGRRVRRLAAARLHLRPRRPCDLPAALRRHGDAAGERLARQHDRDHRDLQGHHQLHLAHRLSRHDDGDGRGRRPLLAAHGRVGRRDAAGARCSRTGRGKTGKPILDGIGATELLHIFITNRLDDAAPGATGRPVRRLRGQDRRRRHERRGRRHDRASRRARADRLPLSRRRRGRPSTCATAGT